MYGHNWRKKSEIEQEVGHDAFECGFLIGHEDYRLVDHETADVFVMFSHQSIQEFFGSFHIIRMFSISDVVLPLFKTRLLVFQFCCFLVADDGVG